MIDSETAQGLTTHCSAPPFPEAGAPPVGRYLAGLNTAQREAVEAGDGPLLVLAGAGTGKTRVLTTRLAHLLASGRARPWGVLAVTFTNKAAREMRERVAAIVGPAAERLWLGTFHALCARILRRHAELVGLRSNFTILDADDQIRLLRQILQAEGIDDKRWPPRALMGPIQRWKDRGLAPEQVSRDDAGDLAGGRLAEVYARYQDRLLVLNAADFGDLLLHCLTLLRERPDVLGLYRDRFGHILVDEYQDTNVAQYLWLRLLAQGRGNICCVGDDDQSIYGWRGAEIGNILKFERDFPGARIVRLERNYRSTPRVLAAASALIAHNRGRLGKTLWTEGDEGDRIAVRSVWDGEAEARAVGESVEARQRAGTPLGEMAVLVRAGFQTREFEERFLTLGVPYRVVGGARFYERMEIRDAVAYLRAVHQPDDDLALERILNKPKRGIGRASEQAVQALARAEGVSLWAAIGKIAGTDELRPAARRTLARLAEDFGRWRALAEGGDHVELARTVLEESGYVAMLQADKSPEAPGRLENLKELVGALGEFDSLAGFLEHIALVMENAEAADGDQVSLMTLHAAKGLEFDVVFLPGWEEGVFPNPRALDEKGAAGLEEERRLAYVGLTRARKSVEISHAASRRLYGGWQSAIPSRFVEELPPEHVEPVDESGLYTPVLRRRLGGGPAVEEIAPDRRARYGPGYGRRGGAGGRVRAPEIDGEGYTIDRSGQGSFAPGDRVFHRKFGMGDVGAVDGDKLEIDFDNAGRKKVVASFVSRP